MDSEQPTNVKTKQETPGMYHIYIQLYLHVYSKQYLIILSH